MWWESNPQTWWYHTWAIKTSEPHKKDECVQCYINNTNSTSNFLRWLQFNCLSHSHYVTMSWHTTFTVKKKKRGSLGEWLDWGGVLQLFPAWPSVPWDSWGGRSRCRWSTPSAWSWTCPPLPPVCPPSLPLYTPRTPPCGAEPAAWIENKTSRTCRNKHNSTKHVILTAVESSSWKIQIPT